MNKRQVESVVSVILRHPGWHVLTITRERGDRRVFESGQEVRLDTTPKLKSKIDQLKISPAHEQI